MFNYSIISLKNVDHVDEVCEDIKRQYEKGVSSCALFIFTLVPEGDPLFPKAEIQCKNYDLFRDKLASMGLTCGALVQCSVGHGYPLNSPSTLTRVKNLTNGQEVNVHCPYDQRFREYIREQFRVIASHKPSCIMVDDDFRLIIRPGKGCACDLHLDAFEKKTGVKKTREEIWAHATGTTEEDKRYRNAFIETQLESLVECAKYMREGIDMVDPTIPGSFCCVGPCCEAATEIATILAGKGNPVQVRVNNGRYTPMGPKQFSNTFMRAAIQIAVLKGQGHVDHFLAETDTCPHNRYSTGAMSLHTHFTGTILEGVSGAKHWITRTANFEQPVAGRKYREVLGKHKEFYQILSDIVPTLKWRGSRIPISSEPDYGFTAASYNARASVSGWGMCVLERLGLPFYFSDSLSNVTFLDGEMDSLFSDSEIKEMLTKTLVLDGGCAERLCKRGFSKYLGVEVNPWSGKNITYEYYPTEGTNSTAQTNAREIKVLDDSVIADTLCMHSPNGVIKETLFPATAVYKNALGGTVIVFGGDARTEFHYTTAFAMLNNTRKNQLIRLLNEHGDLPVYVPDDDEVYLRVADMPDGSIFCGVFNISLDPIDNIRLVCKNIPEKIEFLDCDGVFKPCNFTVNGGEVVLEKSAQILTPVILKMK